MNKHANTEIKNRYCEAATHKDFNGQSSYKRSGLKNIDVNGCTKQTRNQAPSEISGVDWTAGITRPSAAKPISGCQVSEAKSDLCLQAP